jgi:hypothetical protein
VDQVEVEVPLILEAEVALDNLDIVVVEHQVHMEPVAVAVPVVVAVQLVTVVVTVVRQLLIQ